MTTSEGERLVGRKILTALLVTFLTVSALSLCPVRADAPPLSNWPYKKAVTINNTANPSTLSNYQVRISVSQLTGMRPDFADIRFTDDDGVTLLPYWLQYSDATVAIFWVKVPGIPASSIKTIFMYYGNPSASSLSDGTGVFDFFDDFSGAAVDPAKWIGDTAQFSVSGGSLRGGNTNFQIQSTTTHSNPVIIETRTKTNALAWNGQGTLGFYVNGGNSVGLLAHGAGPVYYFCNDGGWPFNYPWDFAPWVNARIAIDSGGNGQMYMINDVGSIQIYSFANTVSSERISLGWRYDGALYNQAYDQQWDWIFARKYASPEPKATVTIDQPQWYNNNWLFRKVVTIDNTANPFTLTGFQVNITVPIDVGMKSDFSDIRFTDVDGTTLLPYWLEWNDTITTFVWAWVKVPSIPAFSIKTIYMYYGNPSAGSLSDGVATFEFFDDFLTADTSKFSFGSAYGGYGPMQYAVAGGQLQEWSNGGWQVMKMQRTFAPSQNVAVGVRFKTSGACDWHQNYFVQDSNPDRNRRGINDPWSSPPSYRIQYIVDGVTWIYTGTFATISFNTWYKSENIKRSPTGFDAGVYTDARAPLGGSSQTNQLGWGDETWTWVNWMSANVNVYYDWIYVRQVAPSDPLTTIASGHTSLQASSQAQVPAGGISDKTIEQSPMGNLLAINMILATVAFILIAVWRSKRY